MSSVADETSSIASHLNDVNKAADGSDSGEEDGEIYEVERILKDKVKKGVRVFLVRWKGYGSDEDSWEPEENLEGAREVLNGYLAELENKKSKPGFSKKPKKAKTATKYKEDSDNGDVESKDSDNEFAPANKRARKQSTSGGTKILRDCARMPTADAPTNNVDRVVARRKNISKNMRWITESSDESSEGSDDDDQSKSVPPALTPLSIHPDSSTDVRRPESLSHNSNNAKSLAGNGNGDRGLLKLRITKNDNGDTTIGGQLSAIVAPTIDKKKDGGGDDFVERSAKPSATSKKQNRLTIPDNENGHPDGSNSKMTFTGVYRDANGEIRYIAVDSKTKKRDDLCLAGAFMADGWSLCRFLSMRIRFSRDGDVFTDGDASI